MTCKDCLHYEACLKMAIANNAIECDNCHWCGKTKLFLRRAVKAWNRRVDNG